MVPTGIAADGVEHSGQMARPLRLALRAGRGRADLRRAGERARARYRRTAMATAAGRDACVRRLITKGNIQFRFW